VNILPKLNLPPFNYRLKEQGNQKMIYDAFRKKYVVLTPEEWVRQHVAHFLVNVKHYSAQLIKTESGINSPGLSQRADIVACNRQGKGLLLVECKAADVKISQEVFDQAAGYCLHLHIPYLVLSNGIEHYACQMNWQDKKYDFLDDIPDFSELGLGNLILD
jgi:hypothetical protein